MTTPNTFKNSNLEPLCWLHISDLHIGALGRDALSSTLDLFGRELTERSKSLEIKPDIILLTGDLTFKGSDEEYNKFALFIEKLYKWLDVKPPVICVPGNHDLNRPNMDDPRNFGFRALTNYATEDTPDIKSIKKRFWEKQDSSFIEQIFVGYKLFLKKYNFEAI